MQDTQKTSLADLTSLRVGGDAQNLLLCGDFDQTVRVLLAIDRSEHVNIVSYGSNILVSDDGLDGTTLMIRGGRIHFEDNVVIADAGVWWDDLVVQAVEHGLWGLELTSLIPGSVGAGVFGNIAAYGQQVSDTLLWVDVFDRVNNTISRLNVSELAFSYRESSLQLCPELVILRAAFSLSTAQKQNLRYQSALDVGKEYNWSVDDISDVRKIIAETRKRAGSLYDYRDDSAQRTAGSFFKNPLLNIEKAKEVASFDESGKAIERLLQQSELHGGSPARASAAHVLLAAGYRRGQVWERVRLHPDHVLKIETLEGATAREVHEVSTEIIDTVRKKLDITLEPEVRFMGNFS